MADIVLSLIQSNEAGPSDVRGAVRTRGSRQVDGPGEIRGEPGDGAAEVECRAERQLPAGAESGFEVGEMREPDAAKARAAGPRRTGRADFRNLLENRLASPEPRSGKSKKEESEPGADQCWSALSATQCVSPAVDVQVLSEGTAPKTSDRIKSAAALQKVADLQTLPKERTAAQESGNGNLSIKRDPAATRGGGSEVDLQQDKGTSPDRIQQNPASASKVDLSELTAHRGADDTETGARVLESRPAAKSHIATRDVEELVKPAAPGKAVLDAAKSPGSLQPERTIARSVVEQRFGVQESSSLETERQLPRDAVSRKEATVLEGEAARVTAPIEAVSHRMVEAASEAAEALKGVQTNVRVGGAEQASAAVAQVQPRANPLGGQGGPSPAEQIIESIRLDSRGPLQEVDIRLNPAELGTIRMKFQHADGEVRGLLFVEKPQTRYEIEKELPQIIASLQQHGVQVRRLEVVANQQQYQHNDSRDTQGSVFAEGDGRFEGRANQNGNPPAHGGGEMPDDHRTKREEARTEYSMTDDGINVYV